jgi:hypothetical protein
MPLDATNFYPKGPVTSTDMRQFYDMFTGVMTDQPATFRNVFSVGGNQGVTTVPLKVYGAVGQNTNLIDLYTDRAAPQPGFGFSALGSFAWGPGGAAPQDTFMSRIALQNGHASDTAGVLVTPLLEVAGPLTVTGMLSSTRMRVPAGTVYPTSGPAPTDGDLFYRSDLNKLAVYDTSLPGWVTGTASFEELTFGMVNTSVSYTVAAGVSWVFCQNGGLTITLPAAASTNRPITVVGVTGASTINAAGGSVIGGSINTSTGAIMNGTLSQGDSLTFKSDGTNWRVV